MLYLLSYEHKSFMAFTISYFIFAIMFSLHICVILFNLMDDKILSSLYINI